MKVTFWAANKPRERVIASAFLDGVKAHGDKGEERELDRKDQAADCDVAVIFGVKGRELFREHWRAGINTVLVDKGYLRQRTDSPVRQCEYWRVAVNGHHPTKVIGRLNSPQDRWNALGLKAKPWRKSGEHILYAGSSAKYHAMAELPDPTSYAVGVVDRLNELTARKIIYRPKPSWHDAVPVKGAEYSHHPQRIADVLDGAHAMVTNGSNACFEAILAGVPTIVLGEAVSRPISSTTLDDVESPRMATDAERQQWLNDLAYCQYTLAEMSTGLAWSVLKRMIFGADMSIPIPAVGGDEDAGSTDQPES